MKTRLWSKCRSKAHRRRRSPDAAVRIHLNVKISSKKEMYDQVWTSFMFSDACINSIIIYYLHVHWAWANSHWLDAAQNSVSSHGDATKSRRQKDFLTCALRASWILTGIHQIHLAAHRTTCGTRSRVWIVSSVSAALLHGHRHSPVRGITAQCWAAELPGTFRYKDTKAIGQNTRTSNTWNKLNYYNIHFSHRASKCICNFFCNC